MPGPSSSTSSSSTATPRTSTSRTPSSTSHSRPWAMFAPDQSEPPTTHAGHAPGRSDALANWTPDAGRPDVRDHVRHAPPPFKIDPPTLCTEERLRELFGDGSQAPDRAPRLGRALPVRRVPPRLLRRWLGPTKMAFERSTRPAEALAADLTACRTATTGRVSAWSRSRRTSRWSRPGPGSLADGEPPGGRDLALPPPAQGQPGGLVPLGRGGARRAREPRTSRSCSRSATRPATGAT